MTTYKSQVVCIDSSFHNVYDKVSDLKNIEQFKGNIPQEYLKGFVCERDYIKVNIEQLGDVTFRVVERSSDSIKFALENIPIKADMVLYLKEAQENTEMKIELNADIPFFLKPVLGNKLQEGIDKAANILARILSNVK